MENSIEKDEEILNNIKAYMQENIDKGYHKFVYNDLGYDEKCVDVINAIEHILSAYRKVLKENEELNSKIPNLEQGTEILMETNTKLTNELNDSISKQKIKDIIDRIDYDIKKTKEIISKNTNIYASYRKNDYQIVRLKAMNTKSLDIKKRLQELLESEE